MAIYSAAIVLNARVMYKLSEDEFKLIISAVNAYRDVLKDALKDMLKKDLKKDDIKGWLKDAELQDTVEARLTAMWDESVKG